MSLEVFFMHLSSQLQNDQNKYKISKFIDILPHPSKVFQECLPAQFTEHLMLFQLSQSFFSLASLQLNFLAITDITVSKVVAKISLKS